MRIDIIATTRDGLSRRQFLKAAGAAALGMSSLAAACAAPSSPPAGQPTAAPATAAKGSAPASATRQSVSLQLPWLLGAQFVGELVAKEKGFYEQRGISIDLQPGGPNANPIQLVAGGSRLAGITYAAPLMAARAQDVPVKAFAAGIQQAPLGYFSRKEFNITSVKDWPGKKLGVQVGGDELAKAVMRANGVDESKVQIINVGSDATPAVTGQVDIIAAWTINLGQIAVFGGNYNVQRLWDNGVRFQSNFYFAKDETIAQQPRLLASLLEASGQGWAYAVDHPDEATDLLMKAATGLNRDLERKTLDVMKTPYIYGDLTAKQGWGAMDNQVWEQAIKTQFELGLIPRQLTRDEVATDEILALAERPRR